MTFPIFELYYLHCAMTNTCFSFLQLLAIQNHFSMFPLAIQLLAWRFVKGFALNYHTDACRGSELSRHKQLENGGAFHQTQRRQ